MMQLFGKYFKRLLRRFPRAPAARPAVLRCSGAIFSLIALLRDRGAQHGGAEGGARTAGL